MKTKIIFLLPLIVLLFSCAKERTIKVSAINPATDVGYADLRITIYASKTGANGEKLTKVYEGYLNENGEVYATFKVKKGRYYVIKCQSPPNVNVCYTNNTTYTYDIHDPNNKEFIFEIAPCAQLKLNIQNVNCEGPNDLLNFKNKYNYTEWGSGWSTDRLGCYTYESPEYFEVPAGWRIYQWRVIRPSGTIIYTDSIYLNAGQNHTFEMFY